MRESQNITLSDLADKSGVQIATLSRIENLKMTGTLESHLKIAKALGADITDLYRDLPKTPEPTPLSSLLEPNINAEPAETFVYNDKASYEILTHQIMSKKMLPSILKIAEGGETTSEQNPPGSERFIFVLEGELMISVGNKNFRLKANNSIYFDATVRHSFKNIGKGTMRAIAVMAPPSL